MKEDERMEETRTLGRYALRRPRRRANQEKGKSKSQEDKLEGMVEESRNILIEADTVFPFTPFPDTVSIDRHKLTVVRRSFFRVAQSVSVPIENIKNIQADIGPIFGSLTITSDHFVNNTQKLNYLRRQDAEKIQKLVQGIMVAVKEGVDISEIKVSHLRQLLEGLGEGHGEKT